MATQEQLLEAFFAIMKMAVGLFAICLVALVIGLVALIVEKIYDRYH